MWIRFLFIFMIAACDQIEENQREYEKVFPPKKEKTMTEIESEIYGDPYNVKSWGEILEEEENAKRLQ